MQDRNTSLTDLRWIRLLMHSGLLFTGWVVLSGFYDLFHLLLGVLSVAIVIYLNRQTYFHAPGERPATSFKPIRVVLYHIWIFKEMVMSAVFVVRCTLSSPDKLRPCLFSFESPQPNNLAKVVLGNSTTLTPGTLTIDIADDRFLVHALTKETAQGLLQGPMPRIVAGLFVNWPGEMVKSARRERE